MPTIPIAEAIERVAVERAIADDLREIYGELYPAKPIPPAGPVAAELARYIRSEMYREEIVDLWNVMFPSGRYVPYDEEADAVRISDHESRYADRD